MLKQILPMLSNIMEVLDENNKLNQALAKHVPILDSLQTLDNLINNADVVTLIAESAVSLFSDIDIALGCYLNPENILLFFANIKLYAIYEKGPIKLSTSGHVFQIIRADYKQKLLVNIIDMDNPQITMPDITIEQTGDILTEITFDTILYENYDAAKNHFESELKSKIPENIINHVSLPRLKPAGDFRYWRANITKALLIGNPKVYKNITEQKLVSDIPEPKIIKKPLVRKQNKTDIASEWIKNNKPQNNKNKLEYYDEYCKSNSETIALGPFTKLVGSLGFSVVKIKGVQYWIAN